MQKPAKTPAPLIDYGTVPLEVPLAGSASEPGLSSGVSSGVSSASSAGLSWSQAGESIFEIVETSDRAQRPLRATVKTVANRGAETNSIWLPDPPPAAEEACTAQSPAEPAGNLRKHAGGAVWRTVHWTVGGLFWMVRTLFGIVSLIFLLAVLAAIPVVNFIALGYLLDVEGRVARSGRLRDAFPLLDLAPRLGSIALGIGLSLFPLRLLSHAAADAYLIDPGSRADRNLHILLRVLTVSMAVHLCLALARGGSLSCFLRPIKNVRWLYARWREGGYWLRAETAVSQFVHRLNIPGMFWLGVQGYVGCMAWLVIPTALFAASTNTEGPSIAVTILGGVLLMIVLSWVPFLQAHFAAERRWGALLELRKVRQLYKHAPFSWLITMLVTLTLTLPLYLLKIALLPRDVLWVATTVFVVSIYPIKVVTGWAYHRALVRERCAFFGLRWISRLVMVPLLALYVFLLFFTQLIGEHGKGVLFEHHAFLLPF